AMEVAFVALTALSVIPIPQFRSFLHSIQRKLAGVVGDSYVFLSDPVQRQAILTRVQRDQSWLETRCRATVVVAHSQGAAISKAVLHGQNQTGQTKLHSLITLGAGIQTLDAIEKMAADQRVQISG